ncbi:MAG TPA: hypothetical protein VFZ70_07330 [Euzebyales bacterium]
MSHIEYHVATVMADRRREADAARRPAVVRQKPRWTRSGPLRRARLRLRLA